MVKGIIFDLDGTLIDSMQIWYEIDRKFLVENGVKNPPADVSERLKKMTIFQSADVFINEFGIRCSQGYVINRIEELVRLEYENNIPLKSGVNELLDLLDSRGIKYGVATATYSSLAEAAMKRLGIYDRMLFLLSDKDYPKGKNFPDIFYGAAEILGTSPQETLVVEDSLHCIETAASAGFMTAAVYDKAAEPDREELILKSDRYFMSLDELRNIF